MIYILYIIYIIKHIYYSYYSYIYYSYFIEGTGRLNYNKQRHLIKSPA